MSIDLECKKVGELLARELFLKLSSPSTQLESGNAVVATMTVTFKVTDTNEPQYFSHTTQIRNYK